MAKGNQYKTNKIPFGRTDNMSTMSKFAIATRLSAAAGTAKVFYMEARKRGANIKAAQDRDFAQSYALAQQIDPSAVLEYIPMGERSNLKWAPETSGDGWYTVTWYCHHPVKGTLEWVGECEAPIYGEVVKRVKHFVCRGYIADTVHRVVVESRRRMAEKAEVKWENKRFNVSWETIGKWIGDAKEEWKAQVPASYAGQITSCDMDEVWDLMISRSMTKEQFGEWLDQRAWDNAQDQLEEDMEELRVVGEPACVDCSNREWEEFMDKQEQEEKELAIRAANAAWTVRFGEAASSDGTISGGELI